MKKCFECGGVFDESFFTKSTDRKSGLNSYCKKCSRKRNADYKKTKRGVVSVIYGSQKLNSDKRGHNRPTYTLDELYDFAVESNTFNMLYNKWVESGYDSWKKPSFDRADDSKGYSFDNFNAWMTYYDNMRKGHKSKMNGEYKNGVKGCVGIHIESGIQMYFISTMDAERKTGTIHSAISRCAKGKYGYLSANGYLWFYEEEYNNFIFG